MFGKLCVQWDLKGCVSLDSRKAFELFCYLLCHPDRPHARESLAETIWGTNSSRNSKKYLRQALWQLQTGLASPAENDDSPILLVDAEWVQLNPQAALWVDVTEFEHAFNQTKGVTGLDLDTTQMAHLKNAVALYRSDFLDGCYEDWCLYERERLQNMYLAMLDKLMEGCEQAQAYDEALALGEKILRHDIASERAHRRMARIYYKTGKRTEALRQYERCVTVLKEELGIKPAQRTIELYELICQDQGTYGDPLLDPTVNLPRRAPFISSSSSDLLSQLVHLQHSLESFYTQVHAEIQTLEATIRNDLELKSH
jgi:DNA-binding SARP family transcriptional activator